MTERKTKAIQIRVTPSQYQEIERAAKKDRRSVADWVRAVALERSEAPRAGFVEGAEVEGGEPGTEDYDTGRVISVDGEDVTVAWRSGERTTQHHSLLRLI